MAAGRVSRAQSRFYPQSVIPVSGCLMSRCAHTGSEVDRRSCFGGGRGEELGAEGLDLALGSGGIDERVGTGQRHDALNCHGGVIHRGPRSSVSISSVSVMDGDAINGV